MFKVERPMMTSFACYFKCNMLYTVESIVGAVLPKDLGDNMTLNT